MDSPLSSPLTRDDSEGLLVGPSIEAMLRRQSPNGAFVASPDFSQYGFCWLRDASFIAYALDRVGEHQASARFHLWAASAIEGIAGLIDAAAARRVRGEPVDPAEMPPARFGLDGSIVEDDWPNFQIDGYGTWLWALEAHGVLSGKPLPGLLQRPIERVAAYLDAHAQSPCFDVWEENGSAVHTSTLGCVYGGLIAGASLLGSDRPSERATEIRELVYSRAEEDGYFVKSSESDAIDASTLWLDEPFGLVDGDDPLFEETVRRIELELSLDGGIRRYQADTYFGGGAWPVLTASLGWHHAQAGDRPAAARCRAWVGSRFDSEGRLGEQFGGELRDRRHFDQWVERWGPPARDLLWSHAMYVVLCTAIDESGIAGLSPAGTRHGTIITKGEGDRS